MPFPLAVFWAISLVLLWSFAGGLLMLALLLGGIIYYAYNHIKKERSHTGNWNLKIPSLLGNLLGENLLLLIILTSWGGDWKDMELSAVIIIAALFIEGYALIMALQKTETK